ncbi:MAG: YgiQ family radical SAM protein [Spirochaetia bacterium]|jgi:uncharacterized radical SAM protein YgiQ|nr:YgiQ family radical SAM protein [Spirochaetia bacterium]
MNKFLPVNKNDMKERGWDTLDFILVTGDAYADHPSFGAAVISRVLEDKGYRVGIIAQPQRKEGDEPFKIMGRPRLGFLVTSGNIDSMVAHYTSFKKRRRDDLYSPGGKAGLRPDRALIPYTAGIREAYKETAVILGGLEASLRRLSHYDYWSGKVRRSILADSKADLLVYGMGEAAILEIAERLAAGETVKSLTDIRGTVYRSSQLPDLNDLTVLHPYEEASGDKTLFAQNFASAYRNTDPVTASVLAEKTGSRYIIQNKPGFPLEQDKLDRIYALPYTREAHPVYSEAGGIPALQEIKFSITSSRGCFGGCSFCSITFHQGRGVRSRSHQSIIAEAEAITSAPDFKGYIHDVGGPTANFRNPACKTQLEKGCCERRCLTPRPCKKLEVDHRDYIALLRKLRKMKNVKKVFIRSGIRFDYLLLDPDVASGKEGNFLKELCSHHISGQLKTAPEHVSDRVLALMGKPSRKVYEEFVSRFNQENRKEGKKQFLVPYFISSHPGSTLEDAVDLALYLKKSRFIPDQVQDFYPTPGTLSTCMFYTGVDPLTMKKVYIPSTEEEKRMQKALIHFHKPENYQLARKALEKAGRTDLIGNSKDSLIPFRPLTANASSARTSSRGVSTAYLSARRSTLRTKSPKSLSSDKTHSSGSKSGK